jgi:hypothetical protein
MDRATYSSILITGTDTMKTTVESLEERIIPCVTAVCPACNRVSLISDGSIESMLCSIYMWQRLQEWIDTKYAASEEAIPARVLAAGDVKEESDAALLLSMAGAG